MTPYYSDSAVQIYHGDALDVLRETGENTVDTVITDPPYALEFMGKGWDKVLPSVDVWRECLRVAKPGSMLMAFGGTRTYHRLTCSIEDAGWQIRDCLMWVYGSGFPKSHDIGKGIDKAAGAEREVVGVQTHTYANANVKQGAQQRFKTEWNKYSDTPVTDAAKQWDGWGTALKPAWEPIVLAMKPLEGTFAENAQKWGVGGLWIDGARIGTGEDKTDGGCVGTTPILGGGIKRRVPADKTKGRWPANLIHDGSEEATEGFPDIKQPSFRGGDRAQKKPNDIYGKFPTREEGRSQKGCGYGDTGTAARFFYCAKASKAERGPGNNHPTVKPLALMRYLVRLTRTPTGGVVLDPFMGSGTTKIAARHEGRTFIGIDKDAAYCEISAQRMAQEVLDL